MRLRELASAALLVLLQAAFICWIMLGPFAWILRDGLGPDSIESHGWDALWRALSFLYWGPVFLALLGANWLCKTRAPLPEEGWQKRWVAIGAFLVLSCAVALMFAF